MPRLEAAHARLPSFPPRFGYRRHRLGAGRLRCPGRRATLPPAPGETAEAEFNDPLEELNRSIFGFNEVVNEVALVAIAKGYRTAVPPPMRASVHDFLQNLNEPVPVPFANDVLQVQPLLAAKTLARLTINSTVGVAGMFDVARRIGIPHHTNDMGITFATYGIGEGP